MKLSIEKRPANNEESYFVFTHGEKKIEMQVNAAKAILLLWCFCSVTIFSFIVGEAVVYQGQTMTIFLMQGNLTNEQGQPVTCVPKLGEKRNVDWNCTVQNLTEVNA
jgi:hypothetical protein